MSFLGFLTQKKFYVHLGLSVLATIVILILVFSMLKSYTRHGEAYIIPDLTGRTISDINLDESLAIFNMLVTDSVFDNSLLPGSIIKQNPSPGSKSKEGRNIYLTTVSFTPKMSHMPEIKDLTIRQAVTTLKTNGLKIRKLLFITHFAENSVLGHYYNGDTLLAGTEILEGSEIDLVVGLGSNQKAKPPFVIGLTRDQSHEALQMASFNYGMEHFLDPYDPLHSRVYRQYPGIHEAIYPGDAVTLYYRSDLRFNFDSLRQRVNPDTAVYLEIPEGLGEDSTEYYEE